MLKYILNCNNISSAYIHVSDKLHYSVWYKGHIWYNISYPLHMVVHSPVLRDVYALQEGRFWCHKSVLCRDVIFLRLLRP